MSPDEGVLTDIKDELEISGWEIVGSYGNRLIYKRQR